jgi:hypothetical protein
MGCRFLDWWPFFWVSGAFVLFRFFASPTLLPHPGPLRRRGGRLIVGCVIVLFGNVRGAFGWSSIWV